MNGAGMLARIEGVQGAGLPWLVAEDGGRVVGFAYAGEWKGVVEDVSCAGRPLREVTFGQHAQRLAWGKELE